MLPSWLPPGGPATAYLNNDDAIDGDAQKTTREIESGGEGKVVGSWALCYARRMWRAVAIDLRGEGIERLERGGDRTREVAQSE